VGLEELAVNVKDVIVEDFAFHGSTPRVAKVLGYLIAPGGDPCWARVEKHPGAAFRHERVGADETCRKGDVTMVPWEDKHVVGGSLRGRRERVEPDFMVGFSRSDYPFEGVSLAERTRREVRRFQSERCRQVRWRRHSGGVAPPWGEPGFPECAVLPTG